MLRTVLKSLLKPDAYPEPTSCVELVQTHVSYIFLTDRFAYKIKKSVDFGFLNFSTIDRRRYYCNEEVRLNSRLCPDIYEGVVEVRANSSGAAFHGSGQLIDYAVKMKRLPADQMLDHLVANRCVTSSDMKSISRVVADFHRTAATSATIEEYGRLERIMFNWQENFDQTMAFEDTTLPGIDRELIQSWVMKFASDNQHLFEQRISDGFIRECDGDIHLENICLDEGNVHIFDCIEFNERYRCCDTAADIAFLLMDLDYHDRHDLAADVISEYITASGDDRVTDLIDFYKIYRAFVRGKVESFRFKDAGIDPIDQNRAGDRAIRYFRLACGYIERLSLPPTLFITCGLMGSGKSSLARQLGFELGICPHSSDVIRKQLAGISANEPVVTSFAEGLYNPAVTEVTYAELSSLAASDLSQGRSSIVDASFINRNQRNRFNVLAQTMGIALVILHTSCSGTDIRRRLTERQIAGPSPSDGRIELLDQQTALFEQPDDTEGTVITFAVSSTLSEMTRTVFERLRLSC
jgi:aminoglycoside phosphotransferase family enzyme/predicted kinase